MDTSQTGNANQPANEDKLIDFGYLEEITGGDEELRSELIEMFATETQSQLGAIKLHTEANDNEKLKQAIHKFRSSLFSVGLLKTASKYKELEALLKSGGTIPNLRGTLAELDNEATSALQILKNL